MRPEVAPQFRTLAVLGASPAGGWIIYSADERRKGHPQQVAAPVRVVRDTTPAARRRAGLKP